MSKSKKLLNNTIVYTIGNLGSKLFSFLLLPVYSFFLSKRELGEYDLILTTITLLLPIVSFQLSQANYRWLINNEDKIYNDNEIFNTSFLSITSLNIISCLILYFIGCYFTVENLILIIFLLVTSTYYPFFQDTIRALRNNKLFAGIGIVNSLLIFCLSIILLNFTDLRIEALLLSSIIANFISLLISSRYIGKTLKFNFHFFRKKLFFDFFSYSWPLIPSAISWWLINASNRYIILLELDPDSNGIYAISSRLPGIIFIFNSIFMLAWQDFILLEKKDSNFGKNVFEIISTALLSIVFIAIVYSKFVVGIFFHEMYFESWKYMGLLYLGVSFSCFAAYFGTTYLKDKNTKQIMTTTLIGGLVNVLISFTLVERIGLFAPAIGTFIGFLVLFLLRVAQSSTFYPIDINKSKMAYLVILCVVSLLLTLYNSFYIDIFLYVICLPVIIYINRKNVIFFYNKLIIRKR